MAEYEFFKREFEFRGSHARMVSELWIKDDYEHTYFKRLIDLYILAAVIGFRADRKAEEDYSPIEPKSIFPEQMINAKYYLDYIMQMIIILDNRKRKTEEECVKIAFRGAETKEEFEYYQEEFNNYVRGGVEELYEQLIVRKPDTEDAYSDVKISNIMNLMAQYIPVSK